MQFKALAFAAALAMGVRAQEPVPEDVSASVIQVLLTALPPSAISLAVTNAPAFQSEIASSLSAGQIPEWYQSLPADVKSILPQMYPVSTPAETTAAATTSSSSSAKETAGTISGRPTGGSNSTTTVNSPTLAPTSTGSPNQPSQQSSNAAAYPSAVVGSGLAGALGVVGLFLL